jgi:putative membrane protein
MLKSALLRWFINAVAMALTSLIIPGIIFNRFRDLLFASALFGILNISIKPIIFFLTLPLNILTLGLFTFIINAAILGLTATLLPGFVIYGFWPALGGAIIISLVSIVLNTLLKDQR